MSRESSGGLRDCGGVSVFPAIFSYVVGWGLGANSDLLTGEPAGVCFKRGPFPPKIKLLPLHCWKLGQGEGGLGGEGPA